MNNSDLENKIFTDFKDLFVEKGYIGFGIECGDGWFDLIYNLLKDLREEAIKSNMYIGSEHRFFIVQIKEKYGGLRCYTSYSNDRMEELIMDAETASLNTCEICGKQGKLGKRGYWYSTACNECAPKDWKECE